MKSSFYNHFFRHSESQYIAFNAFTSSLALMSKQNYEEFQRFCNEKISLSDDFEMELKRGGFVVEDDEDELNYLRFRLLRGRFSSDTLSMTIAPTNDCQFACVYCYEKDVISPKYMDSSTQDKIFEILESRKGLIANFSVVWYGGEPLMALDVVESLSRRFIEFCATNGITYNAVMVTNGYMLTRDSLRRINNANISVLQITLDGLSEVHDKMRPLKSGGKTFDIIIENLKNSYDLLPAVALRINIDKNNVSSGKKIHQFLKENKMIDKIRPYFGKIISEAGTYGDTQCLSICDFSEIHYDFVALVEEDTQSPTLYPTVKSAVCGADSISSFVVDADGWMYKCWCDMGNSERRVGSVLGDCNSINTLLLEYMLFDPTSDDNCKSCNVLPICMGGCPYKRMMGSSDNCTDYKYILNKCLADATNVFQKEREKF